MRRIAVAVCAIGFAWMPVAPAQAATHHVTINNTRFNDAEIHIEIGDTVTWTALERGHTVSASDYRFDFHPFTTLDVGEQVSWTFTDEEFVRYICRVHAPGMSGLIVVGDPPPPPPPPPITGETRRVPSEFPTIDAALAGIVPDSEIILEPGIYEPFTIDVDEVLVRGAQPDEVTTPGPAIVDGAIIDGGDLAKVGVRVEADRVRLRDVQIARVADRAIEIGGDDASIEFVTLEAGFAEGIAATGRARTRISDVAIAGNPAAVGIDIADPDGVLIDRVDVTAAKVGIQVAGGNGVVIRDSSIGGSGTGIALRGNGLGERLLGADVRGNSITQTALPLTAPGADFEWVTGAGIWLDGVWSATIEGNAIDRVATYGIAATSFAGPVFDARIIGNDIGDASIAAVGWDGLGTACTSEAETDPPTMSLTNACGSPRPGLVYPKVSVEIAAHAAFGTVLADVTRP